MDDFNFDLEEELEESEKEETTKPKSQEDDDEQPKAKKPLWKRVLKAILISLLVFVLMIVMFISGLLVGASGSKNDGPQKVQSIKSQSSILDDLESLKDSQINNLNDKLSKITSKDGIPSDAPLKEDQLNTLSVLFKSQSENVKTADKFLEPLMALKNEAPQEEIDLVRKTISEMMTPSSAVTRSYEILKEPTASKMLGENGKKGAASQMWLISATGEDRSYLVVTPFVTKEKIVQQVSFIKFSGQQISDYRFVGLIDSPTKSSFSDALGKINESIASDKKVEAPSETNK